YATGDYSFKRLALSFNQQGIKPVATRGGNGMAPAPLWSGDVIKEILERPSYAGLLPIPREAQRRGDWKVITGTHPAIVSLDAWERCQQQRTRNRPGLRSSIRRQGSPYSLTSVLRCGHCGGPMQGARTGD